MYEDFSGSGEPLFSFKKDEKKMRRENIYNSLSLQNSACHTP